MELLDKNNNPLTHAKYHQEEVKEAVERERQPLFIDVPTHLKEKMREYLEEVSFHLAHFIRSLFQTGPGVLSTSGRFECTKKVTVEGVWFHPSPGICVTFVIFQSVLENKGVHCLHNSTLWPKKFRTSGRRKRQESSRC